MCHEAAVEGEIVAEAGAGVVEGVEEFKNDVAA